jgi:GT2 family glycosyltransferase
MKVAAVVPTWDAREAALGCLASLARSTIPATAIVVDNGSRDGTAEAVRERFPDAVVVRLAENAGFAAGANRGIERALTLGADAVLLLNNDARLEPSALERLARTLEADATLGLVAPRVHDERPADRIWYAGGDFSRATARVRHFRRKERDDGRPDPGRRVGFAPLAVALLSRTAIERVGLLDERFFLYYEDVDLALRLEAAGLAIGYVPDARAWHVGGLTAGRRPVDRFAHEMRSLLHLVRKHATPGELATLVPSIALRHGVGRALLAVARGEPAFVIGALRGVGWFLRETREAPRVAPDVT